MFAYMAAFRYSKGRGAGSNPDSRYVEHTRESLNDGWLQEDPEKPVTELLVDRSRKIITYNQSPDVPFDRSINPYKGCEHGCAYCFARPTHAYLDLSPGLDFETRIFYKPDAATLLQNELAKPGYQVAPVALGANTDAYQPVERGLAITREILKVLKACRHPVAIITKSSLIERDIDILSSMAQDGLVKVIISVTTLDHELSRKLEPRAVSPARRLRTINALSEAGVPTGVLYAPLIPALNDSEMESSLSAVTEAGASSAAYVMLRLPHELKDLFYQWLQTHYPLKADHIMSVVCDLRGGKEYQAQWGERMKGKGEYASLMAQRFQLACKKMELNRKSAELNTGLFSAPEKHSDQMVLF
jgi:DNA repair photolyase